MRSACFYLGAGTLLALLLFSLQSRVFPREELVVLFCCLMCAATCVRCVPPKEAWISKEPGYGSLSPLFVLNSGVNFVLPLFRSVEGGIYRVSTGERRMNLRFRWDSIGCEEQLVDETILVRIEFIFEACWWAASFRRAFGRDMDRFRGPFTLSDQAITGMVEQRFLEMIRMRRCCLTTETIEAETLQSLLLALEALRSEKGILINLFTKDYLGNVGTKIYL